MSSAHDIEKSMDSFPAHGPFICITFIRINFIIVLHI
mgnify:FL=1